MRVAGIALIALPVVAAIALILTTMTPSDQLKFLLMLIGVAVGVASILGGAALLGKASRRR